jgi:hypothetical protein
VRRLTGDERVPLSTSAAESSARMSQYPDYPGPPICGAVSLVLCVLFIIVVFVVRTHAGGAPTN